LDIEAVTVKL
jgi:hypothetical protein